MDRSDASERNKQLAQRMRDALANNQAAYRSLKQDTLLFRYDTFLLPACNVRLICGRSVHSVRACLLSQLALDCCPLLCVLLLYVSPLQSGITGRRHQHA